MTEAISIHRNPEVVLIDYTNHAGVRQVRTIRPDDDSLFFGSSPWHPEAQWLLTAVDVDKNAERTFAMASIHRWGVQPDRQMQIDLSIAAQLQQSMERNARLTNRLQTALKRLPCPPAMTSALLMALKDEEPT